MKRSQLIHTLFLLTLGCVAAAISIKLYKDPSKGPGGDTLALVSPAFFGMVAKKAVHLGAAATMLATIGAAFGAVALWAAISGP